MEERELLRKDVEKTIRSIPDFPKPGILFRDITTVLRDGKLFARVIEYLCKIVKDSGSNCVAGIESRGFILAAPISAKLEIPLALVRKPKKLPYRAIRAEYSLEYGSDAIEMHVDAIRPGERVALIDDLLATGGTMEAATRLVKELGGEIGIIAFLIELSDLKGREKLRGFSIDSLVTF